AGGGHRAAAQPGPEGDLRSFLRGAGAVLDARTAHLGDRVKYLCEHCDRLAEAGRFFLEAGELVLVCQRCGASTRVAAPAAATAGGAVAAPAPAPSPPPQRVVALHAVPPPNFGGEDPFAVPGGRCPKCIAARPEGALTCRA